ncbi:MAG: hypothetical protein I8H72_01285 [Myxococcaceae bacterium]|nr:hypothetical protein [Myxococcaceae bacterium]
MIAEKTKSKRKLVSFKDVQIAYLVGDMDGVNKLLKDRKNTVVLLKKTLKELKAAGRKTESLEAYIAAHYEPGARGRSIPSLGQERLYKAQRIHAGGPFLRLPLTPLGTDKGGVVIVRFEPDQIVVRNA